MRLRTLSIFTPCLAMLAAGVVGGLILPGHARAEVAAAAVPASTPCRDADQLVKLSRPLTRLSHRLAAGMPITIVALGSSSTAGAGASSPAASYPSRLAVELTRRFPGHPIRVVNRGVNGEEMHDMLARFDTNVAAEKPDLVLWQVGTNAVLRDRALGAQSGFLHEGITRMKSLGADVVLIDPQFAPKVLAKPDAEQMVSLIATTAKRDNVQLFRRFALMRHWQVDEKIPFETFVSPDGLHMNDWSYGCFAHNLGAAIAEAATRPVATVAAQPTAR
ncbi:MAG TPA: SGNH/GDSL hydrolase family protein [Pseudolabrys sp.]|nr:SGNH/GDSL hydrolase family protein [Pseudolabrys sp.]